MNAWIVCCESCDHRWTMLGHWSTYEQQAIESRPCPECDCYTLSSPEPVRSTVKPRTRRPHLTRELTTSARLAG